MSLGEGGCCVCAGRGRDRAVGELEVEVLDASGGEDGGVVGVRAVEPHLIGRTGYASIYQ